MNRQKYIRTNSLERAGNCYFGSMKRAKFYQLIVLCLLIVIGQKSFAQDYLDIVNLNYSLNTPASDSGINNSFASANIFLPIVFDKEKGNAFTIGANANSFKIDNKYGKSYDFYNLTIPVGLHYNFNSKLVGDFTILNRINSDFESQPMSDYQLGLISIFSIKKNDSLSYKFGFYYNNAISGPLVVPFFGVNWKVNEKLQVFGTLPRDATVLYRHSARLGFGASFVGQIATYQLHNENSPNTYMQRAKNELGIFTDVYLTKSIVLQAKAGYLLGTVYKEFDEDAKIDWALSLFRFGDDRRELNKLNADGAFAKLSLIYRFDLSQL